jgi:hypothetical protein
MLNNINVQASWIRSTSSCEVPIFLLLLGAEHYQSLDIALTNVGWIYLKMDHFHIDFCNDVAF